MLKECIICDFNMDVRKKKFVRIIMLLDQFVINLI